MRPIKKPCARLRWFNSFRDLPFEKMVILEVSYDRGYESGFMT